MAGVTSTELHKNSIDDSVVRLMPLAAMKRLHKLTWPPDGDTIPVSPQLMHCLFQILGSRVPLDEDFYLAKHPDVAEAIYQGHFRSVRHHYETFGFLEGRQPHRIVVDNNYYLDNNPDVRESIRDGHEKSAQTHFERYGWKEGRMPYGSFDLFTIVL